jgi:hypothetical protein
MENQSVNLLSQCSAGISMALSAINEVLPAAEDPHLRKTLHLSKAAHENLQARARDLLRVRHATGKNPNPMAKGMNFLKTHTMLLVKPGDSSVADLVVTGCNMGVKNLHRYQNRYPNADPECKDVADKLIGLEADLANSLYSYL